MRKYLVIEENKNGAGDIWVEVFDDVERARTAARTIWDHLTDCEKKRRTVTIADVTEDDLADFAFDDGEIDWTCYENCGHDVFEVIGE